MSSSVVPYPSEKRTAPAASSGATPMAERTWLGCSAPLAHDDPPETQTPSSPRATRSSSRSTPGTQRWRWPGSTSTPAAAAAAGTVRYAPSTESSSPSRSRSRRAATRGPAVARSAATSRSAVASPTAPATSWVPLRRSRSCPPPYWRGSRTTRPATASAPTPTGPPTLCALSDTRSAPAVASARSIHGAACTASVNTYALGARRRTASMRSGSGCNTPVSLLAVMTDTLVTRDDSVRASASGSTMP